MTSIYQIMLMRRILLDKEKNIFLSENQMIALNKY